MSTNPATFVLVHGGWWAGDWWWKDVAQPLRAAGHSVYTPVLTGLGPRSHLLSPDVDLSTHILDIANLIKWEELDNIVLVGHSYAGMVISGVAENVPEGIIRSIVYLDAFFPEDGQSVADFFPPEALEAIIGKDDPVPPPNWFGGDNAALTALLTKGGTPHPRAALFEPARLTGARDRIAKKTYVLAATNPGGNADTARKLRADPSWTVEEIDCGHMTMIDAPKETAEILLRAIP
ncbi:alpha/beta fold hydrolase [Parasphingopyxis marina]|uniref:Alpha/beta hydrolase n=1 Tax=Parasphingopyxis marina TaxID=2761622 RepID=A0A842HZR5_9SPHN|nr:alpha/beta hydrolase [Parasphingopyxis marina]MBC2778047.1 alpha/beta hydrolase [Parasphingopyxis marina]